MALSVISNKSYRKTEIFRGGAAESSVLNVEDVACKRKREGVSRAEKKVC